MLTGATLFVLSLQTVVTQLPCTADKDCAGDLVCQSGSCVSLTVTPQPVPPPPVVMPMPSRANESAHPVDRSSESHVNLHVTDNFEMGPAPTLEFGNRVAGFVRVYLPTSFLWNRAMASRDDKIEKSHYVATGIGAGFRFYADSHAPMRGFYVGVATEITGDINTAADHDKATIRVAGATEWGYRWVYDRFLFGLGGQVGLTETVVEPTTTSNPDGTPPQPFAGFVVHMGSFI